MLGKSESQEHPMNEIVQVKLSEMDPESTVNVRRSGIEESVAKVKSSIEKYGYWPESPIILRPHPDPQSEFAYENVTGQCRAEACRQLGFKKIPSVIVDLNDDEALQRSLSEGDKSTPLSFSDYTRIVEEKFNEFRDQGCTAGEAFKKTAEFWNISVAKAKRFFPLGSLPESLKKKVDQKTLPEDAADAIVKSSDSIADEEEKKKVMEAKAEFFGKQERKDRKIAKQAILESGSNATPEELDEKMEEFGHSGKTLIIELEEGVEPKLKKWGADQGFPNKTPLPVIAEAVARRAMSHSVPAIPVSPKILTTTVGSYPVPEWLVASPSEQALTDATRVLFDTQRQAGIDLPTDGELYRFDVNHPDTNGMIDYFVRRFGGCSTAINRSRTEAYVAKQEMRFRAKPAAIVLDALSEGSLNLLEDCRRAGEVAGGAFKFTVTSPYMLARTLLDEHYGKLETLTLAIADLLAEQVDGLPASCLQVDEANVPGSPEHAPLAGEAINRVLDRFAGPCGVHLCFGNYGGQTIQSGSWQALIEFLNGLRADHLVLELAHRPEADLDALQEIRTEIGIGIGVVDVKINRIETADEIARAAEKVAAKLGEQRIRYLHPDCGFWMLKRSIADRKIAALAKGRNQFLGLC